MAKTKPVIVVVRHPDFANDVRSFGPPVASVDIDMGSSFDGAKLSWDEWDTVIDWAVSHDEEADEIEKINPEAASFIRSVVEEALAECLPYPGDEVTEIEGLPFDAESCDVRPFLDARKARDRAGHTQ
jgi:hypothetical protein